MELTVQNLESGLDSERADSSEARLRDGGGFGRES